MSPITTWLQRTNTTAFSVYAMVASFSTYACMYAFRKPFAVATLEDVSWAGIDYKIVLFTAQVLGYTCSKFIGIKVVSEMTPRRSNRRALTAARLTLNRSTQAATLNRCLRF